jgi:hypothetical protein
MWETGNTYRFLVVTPEGKRWLQRLRHGQEDDFKMDLEEA